jgi:hypothetical protein
VGGKDRVSLGMLQLEVRDRNNTFLVDRLADHGIQADVRSASTNPDGSTRTATLDAGVEDNTWKIGGIAWMSPSRPRGHEQ